MPEEKYEVARFDENGILEEVSEVEQSEHVTDPTRKQMKLQPDHDVRNMIGKYRISPDYEALEPIPDNLPPDPFSWYHSRALVAWASIEDDIFRVMCGLIQDDVRGAAVYYTLTTFRLKLDVTHAVATAVLEADAANDWKKIHECTRNAATKRNLLAHYSDMWISEGSAVPYRILVPSMYATGKISSNWKQQAGYARTELEETWRSFVKLHKDINSFADKCGFRYPSPSRLVGIIDVIRNRCDQD